MLRDIFVSYGVLLGSAVTAFLTVMAFGRRLRTEQLALQEAYRALQALVDAPLQTDFPSQSGVEMSA
jgi:hypothetical protein